MRFRGFYHDGLTTARVPVDVVPTANTMQLYREDGSLVDSWPYRGLRLAEEALGGRPARFRHRGKGEAVLTAETPELLARIEALGGLRLTTHRLLRPTWGIAAVSAVLLLAVLAGLWWAFPRLVAPLAALVPLSWEKSLGEKVIGHLGQGKPFCDGQEGQLALDGLTARLTVNARSRFPLNVRVLPDETVNAFAAPGGQIVIFEGLIAKAENPEEVAGVLAHEIAHALERHPMQGALRAMGITMVFGLVFGNASTLETIATEMGQLLLVLSYSRETELEADRVGLGLLNRAGIRGDGLITFFQRLAGKKKPEGVSMPGIFSSHPMHEERIRYLRGQATGANAALTPQQWAALQNICG